MLNTWQNVLGILQIATKEPKVISPQLTTLLLHLSGQQQWNTCSCFNMEETNHNIIPLLLENAISLS